MHLGIDLSEHNGPVDWAAVKAAGVSFVIARLGYGKGHLDSLFYDHINGAYEAGLSLGVYYYSYALNTDEARREAEFCTDVLRDAGLPAARLPMGVWLDMEDADGYKTRHGVDSRSELTGLCTAFLEAAARKGYPSGVYASYDWLTRLLDTTTFPHGTPLWCAAWGSTCPLPTARLWQFTDRLNLGGQWFDGNYCL